MAKGKERPTATAATRNGGARGAGSKPLQAQRPARTAPDAPASRPADGHGGGNNAARLSPEDVYRLIQESAYFKAKARGFAPGHEVQDWIEAEAEVRRRLEGRAA
jgi:DUF2934 family protein